MLYVRIVAGQVGSAAPSSWPRAPRSAAAADPRRCAIMPGMAQKIVVGDLVSFKGDRKEFHLGVLKVERSGGVWVGDFYTTEAFQKKFRRAPGCNPYVPQLFKKHVRPKRKR